MEAVREKLVEEFAAWARERPAVEPDIVATLLDFKATYLDERPTRWVGGDLSELLLEIFPRKVAADAQWVAETIPTIRAFLAMIDETSSWQPDSASRRDLFRELDWIAAQYPHAMADTARWGMAKSLLGHLPAEGVDLADPAAVQKVMDEFNARPYAERKRLTDPAVAAVLPEPPRYPTVRLAPRAELVRDARSSPLLTTAARLASWVGQQRAVTDTDVLRLADAKQAIAELSLWNEWLTPRALDRLRSARDAQPLHQAWLLAQAVDFLSLDGRRVRPTPTLSSWLEGDDECVLEVWHAAFDAIVDGDLDVDRRYWFFVHTAVAEALPQVVFALYGGFTLGVTEIMAGAREQFDDTYPEYAGRLGHDELLRGVLGRSLARLQQLASIEVHDDDTVSLAALGVWVTRLHLLDVGADAPAIDDVRQMSAVDLVAAIISLDEDDASAVRAEWCAARDAASAAAELVEAARNGDPLVRSVALAAAADTGAGGRAALLAALQDSRLRGWVGAVLADRGEAATVDLSMDDEDWFLVDSCAALLLVSAGEMAALREAPFTIERLDRLRRVDHPMVADVLEAVGRGHRDAKVAKAARKAALRARSGAASRNAGPSRRRHR